MLHAATVKRRLAVMGTGSGSPWKMSALDAQFAAATTINKNTIVKGPVKRPGRNKFKATNRGLWRGNRHEKNSKCR